MNKTFLLVLAVFLSVICSSLPSNAAKQTIRCNERVALILFGDQGPTGFRYLSGYLYFPFESDLAIATIGPRSRPDESDRPEALYSGYDYDGNSFAIFIPKDVLGKDVSEPFSAIGKSSPSYRSNGEKTFQLVCRSSVEQ